MFLKLTDEEFSRFAELIHRVSGIYLKDSKNTLLSNRLRKRLREKKINTFDEYYQFIEKTNDQNELNEMLNAVSTNETYFFRNEQHFETLFDGIIPEFLAQRSLPLAIWSAGCSSGEEPYTISMIANERGLLNPSLLSIDATDLNTSVLQEAREGIYDIKKMRQTPDYYKTKYFTLGHKDKFYLHERITESVKFFRLNLIKDTVDTQYDVFCRNVLIYFDKEDQQKWWKVL